MANRLRVAMTLEQCWHRVPGGTAVSALGAARALSARGDIDLVGVAARHPREPAPDFRPAVEVFELPLPRVALYETWHRLRRPRIELAAGKVDAIHATTIAIPPRSAPLVVTIHDLAFLTNPEHFTARGVKFFKRGLWLAMNDADMIVCPSEATRRECEAMGFEPRRLRVVPWGVDAPAVTENDVERLRARYSLDAPYLLWTGTIEPRKNLDGLVDAMEKLDWPLDVVLAGPVGWHQDVDVLAARGRGRVKVLGGVGRVELGALYAGADIFCFPSLLEGFGFPVVEAMSYGTPVVTSHGTSTEEIAADAAVLVDPRNSAAIAEGIASVLEDECLQLKLAEAGLARAKEFTWERTAAELADVYREVAA